MTSRNQHQRSVEENDTRNNEDENKEMEEQETEKSVNNSFKHDIKEAIIKSICILYFIIGLALSTVILSQGIDLDESNGKDLSLLFSYLMILCYIINILLILLVKYRTSSYLACKTNFTVRIKNNLLLYIIAIPLMVFVTVRLCVELSLILIYSYTFKNVQYTMNITYFFFLISVLILMVNNDRIEIMKQYCLFNLLNKASVLLTSVGVIVSGLRYSTRQGVYTFRMFSRQYYNVTYMYNNTSKYVSNINLYNSLVRIGDFLEPLHIAFLIICISYLLSSLMIDRDKRKNIGTNFNSILMKKRNWRSIIIGLLIGISLIIMNILSLGLLYNKKPGSPHFFYFYLVMCVICSICIVLSILQIREMRRWKKNSRNRKIILNKFLMLIGSFGNFIFIINNISINIENLRIIKENETNHEFSTVNESFSLVALIFWFAQVGLQSVVIHLTLLATPEYPLPNSIVQLVFPAMGLFCMNFGVIFNIVHMDFMSYVTEYPQISLNLFHKGIHMISISLVLVYRLHGCLFFGVLQNKVHE